MDVTSNAQAADGAQPEARQAEISADDHAPDKIAVAKQDVGAQKKTALVQDISTPPPPYSVKKRDHFWQLWRMKDVPAPLASLDDAPIIPLASANFVQELLYTWISPLMKLGAARPLQVR